MPVRSDAPVVRKSAFVLGACASEDGIRAVHELRVVEGDRARLDSRSWVASEAHAITYVQLRQLSELTRSPPEMNGATHPITFSSGGCYIDYPCRSVFQLTGRCQQLEAGLLLLNLPFRAMQGRRCKPTPEPRVTRVYQDLLSVSNGPN